jgi:hypothetical protein
MDAIESGWRLSWSSGLPCAYSSAVSAGARGLPDKHQQPLVSRTTLGHVGCVILEKHMPVKGKLLPLGVVYARTE